ncbi:unnamed protein product [Bemisia tabaci]|uniref:Translocator protein n=1 Tax=Bemisia tabaci TaxID=7038 RepID=A0A9P0G515_BEMTA|nr:PREDICTED: translocator protein [Bemisia tabaci]CAH0769948.1 unnamed protein product [Bemisia tabaci]
MDFNAISFGATILPNIGGMAGGYFVRESVKTWYPTLKLPSWRPPNYYFGPVWTTLYSSMGYASYIVYRDGGGFSGPAKLPLAVYGTQLALNWAWTPIFFGAHNLKLALIDIAALWISAAATSYLFSRVNKTAGLLLLPYLAWLTLASALTYTIYRDNKPEIKAADAKAD